ncbi:hypothetical protein I350_02848 [Cryptococcus amylolentus CBS 6273]|uniref:Major facilitator superfamily (MFS) profile domain-containing protein n=1 Tax=Cryptococcus amylolentus CBS 6273 TaxID=1296118 RepID=A0A1E3K7R9_9TREE|nr:hypothetical protein I350_02848 [Cryptococcus amylolentus CBS 6273]
MSSSSPSISLDNSALDKQQTAPERTPESVTRPIPVEHKSTNSQHAASLDIEDHEPTPYSAFSKPTKYLIVGLGAIAAIFSPISSNIFVPAIPTLADQFHRSESDISQAVTIYLVFQAITPSIFGAMSDSFGRRPLYLATLVIYLCANIGLALTPTSTYALLLVLRALQSTGGSAVIAIGYGCVADVAEPRERGTYAALFQSGALLGPALGPLIGGILTQTLGWRSIFWFLVIATGVILVPLTLFLPETLRSLVGNGSIPPPKLNSSPMELYRNSKVSNKQAADGIQVEKVERPPRKPASYQPLSSFMLLFVPEIILIFFWTSLIYLEFYASLTLFSTALKDKYGLSEIKIGLCYLPCGVGTIVSSQLNGRLLDYYFRREERRVGGDYRQKPEQFNIERTRIYCLIPFTILAVASMTAQGWCLEVKAPLAATLVMNFLVGLGSGVIATATIYAQDISPGKGGAVSASYNLVRCAFGAIGTATIQKMYKTFGAGWTFVLLTGLVVVFLPFPIAVIRNGKGWREARLQREERKKQSVENGKGPGS